MVVVMASESLAGVVAAAAVTQALTVMSWVPT
jgi:hypothetical protein